MCVCVCVCVCVYVHRGAHFITMATMGLAVAVDHRAGKTMFGDIFADMDIAERFPPASLPWLRPGLPTSALAVFVLVWCAVISSAWIVIGTAGAVVMTGLGLEKSNGVINGFNTM